MIPRKINTHLFQDLTVLAKANQKGSVIYISKDNKIHSDTIFQKLKALFFKNKKDAKLLVTENLQNQITLSFYAKNIEITDDVKADIKKISEYLVNLITNSEITNSKITNKNYVVEKFDHLIKNFKEIRADDKKPPSLLMDSQLMINAISDVAITNKLSIKDTDEFEFVKKLINSGLDENTNPIPSEKINLIVENTVWIKKNKGVSLDRALSLGKEMARAELKGLTNNEKFNVIQKTLKSFVGTSKEFIKNEFSEQLKNLADSKKNKNIEKDLAEFRKTLSKEQNNLLDKELMKKVLMDNKDWKLNPKETYIQYAQLALSKDNPDIRLHEKYE